MLLLPQSLQYLRCRPCSHFLFTMLTTFDTRSGATRALLFLTRQFALSWDRPSEVVEPGPPLLPDVALHAARRRFPALRAGLDDDDRSWRGDAVGEPRHLLRQ